MGMPEGDLEPSIGRRERFRSAILRNNHRVQILECLRCRPGMNLRQLGRALGLGVTSVQFHIGRLENHGLVATRTSEKGRETLCFRPDDVSLWDRPETRILFGRGPARDLAVHLAENPMTNVAAAAEAIGVSVYTVRRHIRVLEEHDLVERLRVNRDVLYHAEPELEEWVEEIQGRCPHLACRDDVGHRQPDEDGA